MPQPLQASFAFGEMSPRLLGRSNTERYQQSLETCLNVITYSHGNAFKRPGTRIVEQSLSEGPSRLFSLQSDLAVPYVVELAWNSSANGYIKILDRTGYISAGVQLVQNFDFAFGLTGWQDASSLLGDTSWVPPTYCGFEPSTDFAAIQQQIVASTASTVDFSCRMLGGFGGTIATLLVGSTAGASDYASIPLTAGINTGSFTPGLATFWVTITVDSTQLEGGVQCDWLSLVTQSAGEFEAPTPYAQSELSEVQAILSTTESAMYFFHPNHAPQRLTFPGGTPTFTAMPLTNAPAEWAPGNYPRTGTFYQQRLWLASTPQQPDTIWGSQTADQFNFDVGTGGATDAIAFEMVDRSVIQWIDGGRDLLIGGDISEYILTSESGVIQPGDIQAQQQSAYGSSGPVVEVGNGVLYLAADRRRIRFMSYQFLEEGWVSQDITWPSEHITRAGSQEIHFKYAPDPLIWGTLADGTFISAVYEREQNNLVGWHRHNHANGFVHSAALTRIGPGTEFWLAVERETPTGLKTYIERSETQSQQFSRFDILSDACVESIVSASGDDLIVAGLEQLESYTVQPVIAGAEHIPVVVTGGQITLQTGFGKVGESAIVGLQFTGRMVTLPLEGLNPEGTAQAMQKRRSTIYVRLLESAVPEVNGVVTPARFPINPMDTALPDFTGDIMVTNLGWDRFANVTIEMPLARQYNVLAIFGDAEGNVL